MPDRIVTVPTEDLVEILDQVDLHDLHTALDAVIAADNRDDFLSADEYNVLYDLRTRLHAAGIGP